MSEDFIKEIRDKLGILQRKPTDHPEIVIYNMHTLSRNKVNKNAKAQNR